MKTITIILMTAAFLFNADLAQAKTGKKSRVPSSDQSSPITGTCLVHHSNGTTQVDVSETKVSGYSDPETGTFEKPVPLDADYNARIYWNSGKLTLRIEKDFNGDIGESKSAFPVIRTKSEYAPKSAKNYDVNFHHILPNGAHTRIHCFVNPILKSQRSCSKDSFCIDL